LYLLELKRLYKRSTIYLVACSELYLLELKLV